MNKKPYQSPGQVRRRRHGKPPQVDKEWYSKADAAEYLGVAEITLTRYLEKGILHAQRLTTSSAGRKHTLYDYRRLRIHKSELNRYLESVDRRPNEPVAQGSAGQGIYNSDNDMATRTVGVAPLFDKGEELMTRQEAALRLGVSWRTIDRYIKSGVLRLAGYFRCLDSYTRAHIYRSEVERLLHPDISDRLQVR